MISRYELVVGEDAGQIVGLIEHEKKLSLAQCVQLDLRKSGLLSAEVVGSAGDYMWFPGLSEIFTVRVWKSIKGYFGDLETIKVAGVGNAPDLVVVIPNVERVFDIEAMSAKFGYNSETSIVGFEKISFNELAGNRHVVGTGLFGGVPRALYSREVVEAMFRCGARGYFLRECRSGDSSPRWLRRDLGEFRAGDDHRTMRKCIGTES